MAQQIYYLLAYDVDAKQWASADHVLGNFTQGGPLYTTEADDLSGEYSEITDPELIDQDFDNVETLSEFLKNVNK
jgi:hypothetical protein